MVKETSFHTSLRQLLDEFVHKVYDLTQKFPQDEQYGVTSQLRRSALSIILNYIEGYARQRKNVMRNFIEISYGSLKESQYLLYFSYKRGYITKEDFDNVSESGDRIGKMLWGILKNLG